MGEIIEKLLDLFVYSYTGSVILMTYVLLRDVFPKTTGWVKSITTCIIGIVLGIFWYVYILDYTRLDELIYSFMFANAFYSLLIKQVLSKFKTLRYNEKKTNNEQN